MVRRPFRLVSLVILAALLATGGLAASFSRDDAAAAERYRETERERALRYRRQVRHPQARPEQIASPRQARRGSQPASAEPAFWNAWAKRIDAVDDWRSARELFREWREEDWPRWRRWLDATAALFGDANDAASGKWESGS